MHLSLEVNRETLLVAAKKQLTTFGTDVDSDFDLNNLARVYCSFVLGAKERGYKFGFDDKGQTEIKIKTADGISWVKIEGSDGIFIADAMKRLKESLGT